MEANAGHVHKDPGFLQTTGITPKLSKCSFLKERVDYLGHMTAPGKLKASIDWSSATHRALVLEAKTRVRTFVGACNVFRRFVFNFAHRA